ncbi:MAG: TonB-dependent receptor [Opitutaceae bacterium]|nr:TonB-dependent receptor [Opitutaceae bacterium]
MNPVSLPRLRRLAPAAVAIALADAVFAATPPVQTAPIQLDEIVVTATRTERKLDETPGTITAIDLEPLTPAHFGEVVKGEPLVSAPFTTSGTGVTAYQRSGYNSYNIRGIEGNRVLQQIDGIRVPDQFSLGGSEIIGRDYVDPELFKRVEILHGSASALYGSDALGGVVSFATKSPDDYLARTDRPYYVGYKGGWRSVDASLSHLATVAAEAGPFSVLAVYTRRDGHETENNGAVAPNPEDWSSDAILTKLLWRPAPAHRVEFALDYFTRTNSAALVNGEVTAGAATTADLRTHSDTERFRLSLGYTFRPIVVGAGLFDVFEARVYTQDAGTRDRTRELINYNPPSAANGAFRDRDITTAFNNDTAGFGLAAVKSVGEAHRLAFGTEGSRTDTNKPWSSVTTTARSGTTYPVEPRMADTKTDRLGGYVQDEFNFALAGHRATLIPGLRVDQFKLTPDNTPAYLAVNAGQPAPSFDASAVSPKLGFVVTLTPRVNALAQYNRGFRYPTAEDLTSTFTNPVARYKTVPNPNLQQETSDAFEVGLKGQLAHALTVRTAVFFTRYGDFIEQIVSTGVFDPAWPAGVFQTLNRANARIYGGEVTARCAIGAGFTATAAAGFAKGSYQSASGARVPLTTIEPLKVNGSLAYAARQGRWGGALSAAFTDGKRPGSGTVFRAPGSVTFDLSGWWRIGDHISLNFGIYNLTDEKYWRYANIRGIAATNFAEQERRTESGINSALSLRLHY